MHHSQGPHSQSSAHAFDEFKDIFQIFMVSRNGMCILKTTTTKPYKIVIKTQEAINTWAWLYVFLNDNRDGHGHTPHCHYQESNPRKAKLKGQCMIGLSARTGMVIYDDLLLWACGLLQIKRDYELETKATTPGLSSCWLHQTLMR